MVWGEYPSWGVNWAHPQALGYALEEWARVVRRDRNHPCLIGWCPLNETGGGEVMATVQRLLAAVTHSLDPTRPFLDTSGYVHLYPETDVYDCHDYTQDPKIFAARYALFGMTGTEPWNNAPGDPRSRYRGQPYMVSEYGGIRVQTERPGPPGWGYGETDLPGFLARYRALTEVLLRNPNICGFAYTQLTDIEQEQNGIYFYDRQQKYDPALVRAINQQPAAYETQPPRVLNLRWVSLLPTSQQVGQPWRYTTAAPPADWFAPDFDDGGWQEGLGGFGTPGTPGAVIGTRWDSSDIWLRRSFRVEDQEFVVAALKIHHDEDAEVYLNGQRVAELRGYTTDYVSYEASAALRRALRVGENVLAVHCHQTVGGQFIDVGIEVGKAAQKTEP
jgi:hypothetical protein